MKIQSLGGQVPRAAFECTCRRITRILPQLIENPRAWILNCEWRFTWCRRKLPLWGVLSRRPLVKRVPKIKERTFFFNDFMDSKLDFRLVNWFLFNFACTGEFLFRIWTFFRSSKHEITEETRQHKRKSIPAQEKELFWKSVDSIIIKLNILKKENATSFQILISLLFLDKILEYF